VKMDRDHLRFTDRSAYNAMANAQHDSVHEIFGKKNCAWCKRNLKIMDLEQQNFRLREKVRAIGGTP